MANRNVLINEDTLIAIADSIRSKTQKSDLIIPADMPTEINSISGGGEEEYLSKLAHNQITEMYSEEDLSDFTTTLSGSGVTVPKIIYTGQPVESVNLPVTTVVPSNMFSGCQQLKSVNLPLCEKVEQYAFYGCSSITSVNMPVVQEVGSTSFSNCTSLTNLTLDNCKILQTSCFSGCSNLETVSIKNAEFVWNYAFRNCTKLRRVTFEGPSEIADYSFYGCTSLEELETVGIGNDYRRSIGNSAFWGCTALKKVKIPNAYYIGNNAFYNCTNLESVYINGGSTIGTSAFYGCTKLSAIIIATENVNSESDYCTNPGKNPASIFTSSPFASGGAGGTLYVPRKSVSFYQTAWQPALNLNSKNKVMAIEDSPFA